MNRSENPVGSSTIISSLFEAGQRPVLFVGAGLSAQAGLPSWQDISRQLASQLLPGFAPQEIDEILKDAPLEGLAELAGQRSVAEEFKKILKGALTRVLPTNVHRAIAKLHPKAIVTTNYDSLIEIALSQAARQYRVVTGEDDLFALSETELAVVKLHGSVDRQGSIILFSGAAVGELGQQQGGALEKYLAAIFSVSPALFLGVSLKDSVFGRLYRMYRGKASNTRWACIVQEGMTELERRLWSDRGVTIVSASADVTADLLSKAEETGAPEVWEESSQARRRVLIVSDTESRALVSTVARILDRAGLEAVDIFEAASVGMPITDQLIRIVNTVSSAVVIVSSGVSDYRQNVLFELGLFIGRFGAKRVLVLTTGDVDLPSDIAGLRYVFADPTVPRSMNQALIGWAESIT